MHIQCMIKTFILQFSLFPISLLSQTGSLLLENITADHGLTQNSVRCLHQNHQGFLWIGTSAGLNRYDVEMDRYTHYRYDPGNPVSLSDDRISDILKDSQNRMWIALCCSSL